jgi:hypothetical protein
MNILRTLYAHHRQFKKRRRRPRKETGLFFAISDCAAGAGGSSGTFESDGNHQSALNAFVG